MPLEFKQLKSVCFFWSAKEESKAIESADKEILAEAERLDVRAMGPLILSELLFDENIRDQIKKYKRHFLRVSIIKVLILNVIDRPTQDLHVQKTFCCC